MNWNDVFMDSYIVYDLETSGLSPEAGDRIIEVGILEVNDNVPSEPLSWVINPSYPDAFHIPNEVALMTGITDTAISYGADGKEFLPSLMDRFRFKDLIGHNAIRFDDMFLESECKRFCILSPPKSNLYDTASIFKAIRLSESGHSWKQEPHILDELEDYPNFYEWGMYVLSKPIKGLFYNLPFCCETLGISSAGTRFHRAGVDVAMTYAVRSALKQIILG